MLIAFWNNVPMKFILAGRTFDTASATKVAVSRGINEADYDDLPGDAEVRYENVLYRTGKGRFFVHNHNTQKFVKGGKPVTEDTIEEMASPEAAVEWIARYSAVIIDSVDLPLPDEA